jgi:SnoaL-like protein
MWDSASEVDGVGAGAASMTQGSVDEPRDSTAAWVDHFVEGWRAPAEADSFADHFIPVLDPEVRLVQPQLPSLVGHRQFRERFARPLFALIPDLRARVDGWAAAGDRVYVEFELSGTVGGRPVAWPVVDRITLRDGIAVERVSYFDPGPLIRAVVTRPRAWMPFLRARLRGAR